MLQISMWQLTVIHRNHRLTYKKSEERYTFWIKTPLLNLMTHISIYRVMTIKRYKNCILSSNKKAVI